MSISKENKGEISETLQNPKRRKEESNLGSINKKSCKNQVNGTLDASSEDIFEENSFAGEFYDEAKTSFPATQSFDDSVLMNQIESTIELVNKDYGFSSEKKTKALSKTLSELLNKSDIDEIFDEIGDSIYQMGFSQADKTVLHDQVLEVILNNDSQMNNKSPEKGEKSLLDVSSFNLSFGSALQKRLLQNASKATSQKEEILTAAVVEQPSYQNLGPFYGLPLKVKELIKIHRGIDELYDWQNECLSLPPIQEKTNLIYALPTSGGKTLVAEILILREILCYKKNALFILPFVAIVQEKVWGLSPFGLELDFLVEEYAGAKGTYPPRKRRRKNSVFIATIEKALGLLNSLIETGRLDEFGLIVVDELHLIGESKRGPVLEAILTKLSFMKAKIQIVGMSATIGNLEDISRFLNAETYTKDFRPVKLNEFVSCNLKVWKIDSENKIKKGKENYVCDDYDDDLFTFERRIDFYQNPPSKNLKDMLKQDPDQLAGLVSEVAPNGSCLVFCATKKNCENVAKLLYKIFSLKFKLHREKDKKVLLESLEAETGTICQILKYSIPLGVAYHHSGLTSEERRIIEEGFRGGVISVICCTSTLAAGVNLPAQRVIIRAPRIGTSFINLSRYKQMVGRAGRAGLQEKGDSILICEEKDMRNVAQILRCPMDEALSKMDENEGNGLRSLLLSCICLGIANTRRELQKVTKNTLLAVQNRRKEEREELKNLTDTLIRDLLKLGAIETDDLETNQNLNTSIILDTTISEKMSQELGAKKKYRIRGNQRLVVSKLGLAAIKGGFDISRAQILYEDLVQAKQSLVLMSYLHLLYLMTPYDLSEQMNPCNTLYFEMYNKLSKEELCVARILGINEGISVKIFRNLHLTKGVDPPRRVVNRFYLTLILYDLWKGEQIFDTAQKFEVDRGLVQNLMQASATFGSNVVNFCQELEDFWPFVNLLKEMSVRIAYCCTKELLPLMELPSVKQNRAKQLYNAGYKTLHIIAKADVNALVRDVEHLSRQTAYQIIASAKMLLLEKVENLREKAEDVLEGLE